MKSLAFLLSPLFLTIQLLVPAYAQSLPVPSRTVFKCEINGKVVYSDSPCLGAQRLDIQPTRGVDKSTGNERIGKDVRQERSDEQMAKAWEPIFAETPEQRAKRHRRAALKPEARTQCSRLDQEIALAEQAERSVTKAMLSDVQSDLMRLRRQYRESRC
ncbi:hypothetical protein [Noviherbaspirillum sedimenti]|uniref:hypothetical protein n=1 Tax=Noviherbaspirillum sedimenti TaxID=2320865 RepID=UPI0011C386D2|nr:hypothetical protein [Noviherbaspirillum sedimenti]